jgi:hypothetical protein
VSDFEYGSYPPTVGTMDEMRVVMRNEKLVGPGRGVAAQEAPWPKRGLRHRPNMSI